MAELYSIGRGLRSLAGVPSWLPIPFTVDHAIELTDFLYGSQEGQRSRKHVSWSKWRASSEQFSTKAVHLTMHPMVALRRMQGIHQLKSAKGTLVFVPHSLPYHELEVAFEDEIEAFLSLPKDFQPLVLCLQMYDVHKGLHKRLRKFNLPIVSAGDINSLWFADRFYSILQNFRYASSPTYGSHAFLSEEMGVSFFLRGDASAARKEINANSSGWGNPGNGSSLHRALHFDKVFRAFPPVRSLHKDQLVDYALGTDVPLSVHRKHLKRLFWGELFLNFSNFVSESATRAFKKAQSP